MLFVTFIIENEFFQDDVFWIVEGFFYLDFILCWFQGYKDDFTQMNIMEYRAIAKNYMRGWFIIDLICIIPITLLYPGQKNRSIKLLRLPRLIRITKLLNIKKIKTILK